jgi:hypothetical protein
MTTPFTHRTERYYGSERNIHTISWKGHGEVDAREIYEWCIKHFGPAGYQEETGTSRWVNNTEQGEVMLCNDSDLTYFLLIWQ